MRKLNPNIRQLLTSVNPAHIAAIIEHGIRAEKLNLEAHRLVGDEEGCRTIKHRIADAELFSLWLTGDLPS